MTTLPSFIEELNPKFVHYAEIHFDELDPMQMLHNSRFACHVERAISALYASRGRKWERDPADNPDQFHVVRDLHIEYLSPFIGTGRMRIETWVEKLGTTSCVYGFVCSSEDGRVAHARGERTIIKIDPQSHRPSPWTESFRAGHSHFVKDFRACP
jgi:acyl-CoA thioester hydrolase